MNKLLQKFWQDEAGLELSEYAIMIALILVIAAATITLVGEKINAVFQLLLLKLGGSTG